MAQLLSQDIADMKALQVRATPGFFVNGRPLTDFGEAQLRPAHISRSLVGTLALLLPIRFGTGPAPILEFDADPRAIYEASWTGASGRSRRIFS